MDAISLTRLSLGPNITINKLTKVIMEVIIVGWMAYRFSFLVVAIKYSYNNKSYNAKKMLALPSNPDSYELSFRFFFFSNWLKFLIVWNTDVPSYEFEPNMPT